MTTYTMIVLTNCKEGRDDEFNDWYTNQHLGHILDIPGFTAAQRLKLADQPGLPPSKYRYGATYTLETDDPAATITDMFARHGTPALPSCDAMDEDSFFALYEAITPIVTK